MVMKKVLIVFTAIMILSGCGKDVTDLLTEEENAVEKEAAEIQDQDVVSIDNNDTEVNAKDAAQTDEDVAQESDVELGEVEIEGVEENVQVSGCRGFNSQNLYSLNNEPICDHLISWKYNKIENILSILNQDVMLNCCGEHDVRIEKTEDGIKYTMIDNSVQGARCGCSCLFDFSADVKIVSQGELTISVRTDVEENEGPEAVWEGKINLSEGSGTIVVKERSGDHCW